MRSSQLACAVLTATFLAASASASVVTPPSFESLVAEAGEIFVGQVTERASRPIERGGKGLIVTDVTFRIERVMKGSPGARRTLTFLGGIIGDTRQEVAGMPSFMIGERDVLFVRGDASLIPIVGLFHGRFRIVTGRQGIGDYVANNARQPLISAATYSSPARLRATDNPLPLERFLEDIRRVASR